MSDARLSVTMCMLPATQVKNFVSCCNGGLYFGNYYDFQETVKYILNHPDIADIMAKNGHDYVCDNFAWDIMVQKYKRFFKELEEQHAK